MKIAHSIGMRTTKGRMSALVGERDNERDAEQRNDIDAVVVGHDDGFDVLRGRGDADEVGLFVR